MNNNVTASDRATLIEFLSQDRRLTHGLQVEYFEQDFSDWLGVNYSVMVNSGASANLITLQALQIIKGDGRVLVPCIGWVSDVASILHAGLEPWFVDVDPMTLGMDCRGIDPTGKLAALVVHCLGFSAFPHGQLGGVPIIEDCCESPGATYNEMKLGTYSLMSNFSFYYAHHMTTIEGGMVCTNDPDYYQLLRMLRSHGLVRESSDDLYRHFKAEQYPDLDPNFIFTHPAYNVRPTELNAVLGRSQLKRLDDNNLDRTANLEQWLASLDVTKYRTEYRTEGSSNYALPLILLDPDYVLMSKVLALLDELDVEYRKGTAGGGNQLRQPYARARWGDLYKRFPQAEHIHQYGLYIGNYPDLEPSKITQLCERLASL